MKKQNEGGGGEGRISLGRVQKMDPVERTAGRLEFRESRPGGWLAGPTVQKDKELDKSK